MRRTYLSPLWQRLGQENWRALVLLMGAFAALALGVTRAVNGLEFELLWPPVFLGLTAGWLLAASRISGRLAAILVLLLGPAAILVRIGNLGPPLVALGLSPLRLLWQTIVTGNPASTAAMSDEWRELSGAAGALTARLYSWLLSLGLGEPAVDPVATAALWLMVLLGTALWASWSVRRRERTMSGLLPGMFLVAAMGAISSGSAVFLVPAVALALILKASVSQRVTEQRWRSTGIRFSPRFGSNATWTATGLALVLMVLALVTPSISIYRLVDAARTLAIGGPGENVARSVGLEPSSQSGQVDAFAAERLGGLPARHLIGSGPELSQQAVMAIGVEEPAAFASQLRYWRGLTYDRYTGRGWQTGATATVTYSAGELASETMENQQLVRLKVWPLAGERGLLYAAGELVTVDKPFQIAWRAHNRVTETYLDAFAASTVTGGTGVYRTDSLLPSFDETELRSAGQKLPGWIAEKYLSLPEAVSGRVLALARDLTATEPTAYDRARAIESHLRQFPYTLDLPGPPAGREIADYFLFELQRGYCDYYATAMVVLARAAGLPSRLATGYVGGAYDPETNRYTVTADLAHSWPEIYFPDYGWIAFEPTAGRAAIDRAAEPVSEAGAGAERSVEPGPEEELESITTAGRRARWQAAQRIAAGLLLSTVAFAFAWWLLDTWRLRFLTPAEVIGRLFERLGRGGRRLGIEPEPGETPNEFAGRLSARLVALSSEGIGSGSLASAPEAIQWLTALYALSLYSPHEPEASQKYEAIRTWWRLRSQLLWASLLLRFRKATS